MTAVVTSVEKAKRMRRRQSRLNTNIDALNMFDVHDVAYWSQWRLAIHGVCARFEAVAQVEADAWSRERLDHVSISRQQALSREVRHLEAQLGKHTSMNAKLESALFENAEVLAKTESARANAAAAVARLQVGRVVGVCYLLLCWFSAYKFENCVKICRSCHRWASPATEVTDCRVSLLKV